MSSRHIEVGRISLVRMYARNDGPFSGWAYLWFDEVSGIVSIFSDFGNWSFCWPPRHRTASLGRFLSSLDWQYMGSKMLGASLYYSVPDESEIKTSILKSRRSGAIGRYEARGEWDLAESGCSIDEWFRETKLDVDVEYCLKQEVNPSWKVFWEEIWEPLIQPRLKAWPKDKSQVPEFENELPARPLGAT